MFNRLLLPILLIAVLSVASFTACSCGDDDDDDDSTVPTDHDTDDTGDDTGDDTDDDTGDDTDDDTHDDTDDDTGDDTGDDDDTTPPTTTTTVPPTTTTTSTTTVVTTTTTGTTTTTFADQDCTDPLDDPSEDGSYSVTAWEYGDSGDPDAVTTDISDFFNSPVYYVWHTRGITMDAVPLHAVGYYPVGTGPFPVVLIVHGNHSATEMSYPGYDYLTHLLATNGIIAVSVEEDFLNGGVSGENDARAVVLLRHLQLFREWNEDATHPLYHKINMNLIGLAGHSRGGEAVVGAWYFNTYLHDAGDPDFNFNFGIQAIYAIAPVDGQLTGYGTLIPENVGYFIMHGSHDGDVYDYQGAKMYDRAFPVDDSDTYGYKGALFVQGANHGQWNTVWGTGSEGTVSSDLSLMSGTNQRLIGKLFIGAWFRWTLLGENCYRLMAAGELTFPSFPTSRLSRQYQDPNHLFFAHYQEDSTKTTTSISGGSITASGLDIWTDASFTPGQTRVASLAYDTTGTYYEVDLPATIPGDLTDLSMLAFRVGQTYESSDNYNVYGDSQDFSVAIVVDGDESDPLPVSDYRDLLSPVWVSYGGDISKTTLETVRIPLDDFFGSTVDPAELEAVIFYFDVMSSGYYKLDEVQLTKY